MRKDERRTDDRKCAERKQQESHAFTGKISHRNQLSSLGVGEPELYINHHNISFKGKEYEKVRVVKTYIGSKILTSVWQDSQNSIQPASDSNSASKSDSDKVEHIVGSSRNSSDLNDSGD